MERPCPTVQRRQEGSGQSRGGAVAGLGGRLGGQTVRDQGVGQGRHMWEETEKATIPVEYGWGSGQAWGPVAKSVSNRNPEVGVEMGLSQ